MNDEDAAATELIPVGISSCLLGEKVRFDGGHKNHSYIGNTLGKYFQFRPFCPEVNIGLGIPRKPIRLWRNQENRIRVVAVDDLEKDYTDELISCSDKQINWQQELCGYILKKDSPSCGMERVKVWAKDMPVREGEGAYAAQIKKNFPYLPLEEEGRLGDAVLRENFVQRVFTLHRWQKTCANGISVGALVEFHARHKLVIMSHNQNAYRELGRLVAATTKENLADNANEYLLKLMAALKKIATRGNHLNVLQHIQGYLKNSLDPDDKQELVQTFESYFRGNLPLIVPITLLNHYFRKFPDDYIEKSWYMNPYPAELNLQNLI